MIGKNHIFATIKRFAKYSNCCEVWGCIIVSMAITGILIPLGVSVRIDESSSSSSLINVISILASASFLGYSVLLTGNLFMKDSASTSIRNELQATFFFIICCQLILLASLLFDFWEPLKSTFVLCYYIVSLIHMLMHIASISIRGNKV